MTAWFETWFNSKYYHLLYNNRNDDEAKMFINNLLHYLKPNINATALDMACGKGRHSKYLNEKQLDVIGIDLASNSIKEAKQFENNTLQFFEHDMRNIFRVNYFDYVFSFFTSMGYFENAMDDAKQFKAIGAALKPGGSVVIDFMNAKKIATNLVATETVTRGSVMFEINRFVKDGFINKTTKTTDGDFVMNAHEKVKMFDLKMFENLLAANHLSTQSVFGNYALNPFDETTSDRLIIHAIKNKH